MGPALTFDARGGTLAGRPLDGVVGQHSAFSWAICRDSDGE